MGQQTLEQQKDEGVGQLNSTQLNSTQLKSSHGQSSNKRTKALNSSTQLNSTQLKLKSWTLEQQKDEGVGQRVCDVVGRRHVGAARY